MQGFKERDTAQLAAWGVDMVFADAANLDGDGSVITQGYLVPTHSSLTLRPLRLGRCAIFLLSFAAYEDLAYYISKTGRNMSIACMMPYYLLKRGVQVMFLYFIAIHACINTRIYVIHIPRHFSVVVARLGNSAAHLLHIPRV